MDVEVELVPISPSDKAKLLGIIIHLGWKPYIMRAEEALVPNLWHYNSQMD